MKKKILVVIGLVILLVIGVVLLCCMQKTTVDSEKGTDILSVPMMSEDVEITEATRDSDVIVEEILPVDEIIFEDDIDPSFDDLFDIPEKRASNTVTVEFDSLIMKPGMKVSDIIDSSDWHTLREMDVLQPDEAGYLILNNNRWTNGEIQLNSDSSARNGEIILWVHNYSDSPVPMRDCTIYKYKINYLGCADVYTEQPEFSYLDKYTFGYKGSYKGCNKIERAADNGEAYIRYIFGDINECQVILDSNDDEGLFAITVSCNEFYGPDFGLNGGDENG